MERPGGKDTPFKKVRLIPQRKGRRGRLKRRGSANRLRRGIFLLPSLFTAGNLFCGVFAIIFAFNGEFQQAAVLIVVAHLLDGVDGAVARLTHTSSQFGVEFDSLADVVSFGVAPAALMYVFALTPWGTWGGLGAALFAVCGALRLARFNVQTLAVEKSYFTGLPIPAAAAMIAATIFMYYMLGLESTDSKPLVFTVIACALAGLMVSNFRYFSLKQHHFKKRSTIWLLLSALAVIILTIAMWQIVLFSALLTYTLSGPLLGLLAVRKRRREEQALLQA
jgi:CDP-diacylglycerol--serine O-phosphatidyltransferase